MGDRDSSWLRTHEPSLRELTADLDGLRELLLSKLEAQSDALAAADKRYEQRFMAQEGAVTSALNAQEKAVNAAMIAADRAVSKVETANDKRFESVNEFRAQLADQAAGFLPRNEGSIRFDGVSEKLESQRKTVDARLEQIRIELQHIREAAAAIQGKSVGMNQMWGYLVAAAGSGGVIAWIVGKAAQ